MKILDLGEFYSERGGGVRSYLNAMLSATHQRGHELIVVAPGPEDRDERVEGGRIVRYRAPHMPYDSTYHVPFRVDVMRRIVREVAPDVLQLSSPLLPWVAARRLQVPVSSYVYHSDPIGAYFEPAAEGYLPAFAGRALLAASWAWMRTVCRGVDVTVVAGQWLGEALKQRGVDNAIAIPFGIEHERFGPERSQSNKRANVREELLARFDRPEEARLVVMAGRLAIEKRQALIVEAVGHLAKRRPVALLVLGDGPERARLQDLASRLVPVHRFLPFTKSREEYAEVLASADALAHGSRCETYGFVLVEALASGTPLLVPDQGGAAHAGDESCCVAYPRRANAREVADALDELLSRPREAMRAAAVRAARRHPSKLGHFDRLFEVYADRLTRRM